jgi:hypothetical protein
VEDYAVRKFVPYNKDFGWMALWELNPETLELLWLMASVTWKGNQSG